MRLKYSLINLILPTVVLLLSGACSIRYYYPVPGVPSEDRYAIIRSDSLLVVLRPQSYSGAYSELNNRFFPVFLSVKNNSDKRIKLNNSYFSILTPYKQYDPIPVDYLLANLRDSMLINSISDPFDNSDSIVDQLNTNKDQEMYYEVLSSAFSYGDLLPGGTKEGYLFYDRDVYDAVSFSVDVLGQSIGFIKQ